MSDCAWAVGDGQCGRLADGVSLVVHRDLGCVRAVGGKLCDDLCLVHRRFGGSGGVVAGIVVGGGKSCSGAGTGAGARSGTGSARWRNVRWVGDTELSRVWEYVSFCALV